MRNNNTITLKIVLFFFPPANVSTRDRESFSLFQVPGIFRTREIHAAKWCEKYVKHAGNIWTTAQTFLFCFVFFLHIRFPLKTSGRVYFKRGYKYTFICG